VALDDKIRDKAQTARGKAKDMVGRATDEHTMETEARLIRRRAT
jgi:uncharacterized protein YjbJ (UPF0337 family)